MDLNGVLNLLVSGLVGAGLLLFACLSWQTSKRITDIESDRHKRETDEAKRARLTVDLIWAEEPRGNVFHTGWLVVTNHGQAAARPLNIRVVSEGDDKRQLLGGADGWNEILRLAGNGQTYRIPVRKHQGFEPDAWRCTLKWDDGRGSHGSVTNL